MEDKKRSIDPVVEPLLEKAAREGIKTAWDRLKEQDPQCGFGQLGLCCRHCSNGPCRIDPFGEGPQEGVCGATADTIAARHFARMAAAGTAAHSDHARQVCATFLEAAEGKVPGYGVKDEMKLYELAMDLGIEVANKPKQEIAIEVGKKAIQIFGSQEGEIFLTKRAPIKRLELWRKQGVVPRGVDREVVEIMHRTHIGVDQEYHNIIQQAARCSLADGWGGSMIATELQDIMFGTPEPILSKVNLGVLKEDQVNIIVHGHEPLLSEMIVVASRDPEMLALAKSKGAAGINLAGICCTANEVLMRHGIPLAGNFLHQEIALITGVVDALVADVQCVMQSLGEIAQCYHTKVITTNYRAKMPFASHIQFDESKALEIAKRIVRTAIENFPNR